MHGDSPRVESDQQSPALQKLEKLLVRHARAPFLKPLARHTQEAFQAVLPRLKAEPFVLDLGCGTGDSSYQLAQTHPQHLVVGVDKSKVRLQKRQFDQNNLCLIQADLIDFWRLLYASGLHPHAQYILYPNPWPKSKHLERRWQGHPVFPFIVECGGHFELRSNWRIYLEEFVWAVSFYTGVDAPIEALNSEVPLTPFEKKYATSAHDLWRVQFDLKPGCFSQRHGFDALESPAGFD